MGKFIGGLGAAFIMAAAAAVIVKLLLDVGIIKDKRNALLCGKISLYTIAVGTAYVSVLVLMYNAVKGSMNFFAFDKIFDFTGIGNVLELCENPEISSMFSGIMMPLYPCLVHAAGRIVFNQYVLTAQFISFASACVSACMMYSMLAGRTGRENAEDIMFIVSSLPYAFMLFAPTYLSLAVMFIICGAYALSRGSNKGFVISAALACFTCKIGILAFLLCPLKKYSQPLIDILEKTALRNERVKIAVISVLVLLNGFIMCCLIRGMH